MIKAAIQLAEKEVTDNVVARVYLIFTHSNGVTAACKTEEIELKDPDLLEGRSIVARRSTEPITKEGVDACAFLDVLGLYNRVGALVTVKEEEDDDTGSDNAS